jgi:hypothetical protein
MIVKEKNMNQPDEQPKDTFSAISNQYREAMLANEKIQEDFWNSLTTEQQLLAFCAISRRIYQGEMEDKGSYRHVLYGIFKFGPDSYSKALDAGYFAIHNSIMTPDQEHRLLEHFAKENGLNETAVSEYYKKFY